jgi:hypothetical protein
VQGKRRNDRREGRCNQRQEGATEEKKEGAIKEGKEGAMEEDKAGAMEEGRGNRRRGKKRQSKREAAMEKWEGRNEKRREKRRKRPEKKERNIRIVPVSIPQINCSAKTDFIEEARAVRTHPSLLLQVSSNITYSSFSRGLLIMSSSWYSQLQNSAPSRMSPSHLDLWKPR